MPVALRIALRELRGGLRGFRTFLLCLALGVAAIAAVGSVRAAIEAGIDREAASILGGDATIQLTYRFADPDERAWIDARAQAVSEIVDFRSMAVTEGTEGPERALVQVKGVDDAYPLYGTIGLEGATGLAEAFAPRDGLPGLVAAPALIDRLGLAIGDPVRLGDKTWRLAAALTAEPDAGAAGLTLGPRVLVRTVDLEGSGLLAEGTLFETAYRLRLPGNADLAALRAEAEARFAETGLQWRDRRGGVPGLDRFIDRLGSFLVLMGLAGLAVGGIGVSSAVRAYLDSRTETIATLKTLGASGGTIFAIYLAQIGLLALLGIAAGLVLGGGLVRLGGPIAAEYLPLPADFVLYPAPLAEAALYGLLTALVFTLWPLARARDIRASSLFRDLTAAHALPRPRYIALVGGLALLLVAAATLFSDSRELALWAAGSVLGALALLALAARAVAAAARRLARAPFARGRPALRLALGAVGGPGGETASVVLSLGLGLAVLSGIGQIDANLRSLITTEIPSRAPAFFVVDIQNDQLPGFLERTAAEPGVEEVETAPMLRGIITRINDRPAREVVGRHWALSGDRGVTYAAEPAPGTVLTEGEWWPADYDGPPLMSFSAEEGAEMGLKLGDSVTVNLLGRDVTATIANFREVEFESMGISFLMVLDPAALAGAPASHIATIYAAPEAESALLRDLAGTFPNITMIGVRETIDRVSGALAEIAAATRWGAAITLATGIVVLIGAAAAGTRRRVFESAVLKTLGATRPRILASFALRAAILGAAAGIVAILAGALAGWAVTAFVLESRFAFAPGASLGIVLGGALASLLAGLAFALPPLRARPARILRARE